MRTRMMLEVLKGQVEECPVVCMVPLYVINSPKLCPPVPCSSITKMIPLSSANVFTVENSSLYSNI